MRSEFLCNFSYDSNTVKLNIRKSRPSYVVFLSILHNLRTSNTNSKKYLYGPISFNLVLVLARVVSLPWRTVTQSCQIGLFEATFFIPICYSPWSAGSRAALVIVSHYPPRQNSELIETDLWVRLRPLTHHTHPTSCSKGTDTTPCQ